MKSVVDVRKGNGEFCIVEAQVKVLNKTTTTRNTQSLGLDLNNKDGAGGDDKKGDRDDKKDKSDTLPSPRLPLSD